MDVVCILLCAGSSKRMGGDSNKIFLELGSLPLVCYSLFTFEKQDSISRIVVVAKEKDKVEISKIIERFGIRKVENVVVGGATRKDSLINGLLSISNSPDYVIIHDGARPFVTKDLIDRVLEAAFRSGGAIAAIPCHDTVKIVKDHFVKETVPREEIWFSQTPQAFSYRLLKEAVTLNKEVPATDDSMFFEAFGKKVEVVEGSFENIKITTPFDLLVAKAILEKKKFSYESWDRI